MASSNPHFYPSRHWCLPLFYGFINLLVIFNFWVKWKNKINCLFSTRSATCCFRTASYSFVSFIFTSKWSWSKYTMLGDSNRRPADPYSSNLFSSLIFIDLFRHYPLIFCFYRNTLLEISLSNQNSCHSFRTFHAHLSVEIVLSNKQWYHCKEW